MRQSADLVNMRGAGGPQGPYDRSSWRVGGGFGPLVLSLLLAVGIPGCSAVPLGISPIFSEGYFQSGSVRLHYVMDFPEGDGPFPLVVLGHGSGPKTANDLRGFARGLLDMGVATLRFDRRGTGSSGGTYRRLGQVSATELFPVLAEDVARAVEVAVSDPRVDTMRVGLFGESQAGWVLPLAGSESSHVSYMVLLSGPAVDVGLVIKYENLTQEDGLSGVEAEERISDEGFLPDWQPLPYLRGFTGASLWIYGGEDRLVPPRMSIAVLDELIVDGGAIEYRELPGHDHGLRPVGGATRVDYWPIVREWMERRGVLR